MRLMPAEELEPYLEEAFSSSFEERLAIGREVVGGLGFPFPETLLEPLLEEAWSAKAHTSALRPLTRRGT
jgi:hypothetical protein